MSNFRWEDISEARRESMEKGVIAIRRINERETFKGWMQIGASLDDAQKAAMELAHTNEPKGRGYNDAWKMISKEVPDLININQTTRSHAVWMAQQRDAIEAWHATLPLNLQQAVNHPTSVWRRYNRTAAAPRPDNGEKPPTISQKKDAEIARLQEELDSANRQLRHANNSDDRGPAVTRSDTAEDVARVLKEFFGPTKAGRIASLMLEDRKSTKSRSAGRRPSNKALDSDAATE